MGGVDVAGEMHYRPGELALYVGRGAPVSAQVVSRVVPSSWKVLIKVGFRVRNVLFATTEALSGSTLLLWQLIRVGGAIPRLPKSDCSPLQRLPHCLGVTVVALGEALARPTVTRRAARPRRASR